MLSDFGLSCLYVCVTTVMQGLVGRETLSVWCGCISSLLCSDVTSENSTVIPSKPKEQDRLYKTKCPCSTDAE